MLKNIDKTFLMERLYLLTDGWYWNISLLPVPPADSLNSLVEALVPFFFYTTQMLSLTTIFTLTYI